MIEIRDFTFCHRGASRPAVEGVSLSVPAGSFVGITGSAGSGKSTLVQALCGVVPHRVQGDFYGMVAVGGQDVCETSLADLARTVGCVCQDVDSQFVASIVEDEILYGLENFGVDHGEIEGRLTRALDDMGIGDLRQRSVAALSGGQKQKVAIAAILALEPQVLVLDEPTAELDPASSQAVYGLLARYAREHGTTVVAVEQKVELLARHADLLVVMEGGRVRFADEPRRVLEHDAELARLGVRCPASVALVNRLRTAGLCADVAALDVDDAVAAVAALLASPRQVREGAVA